jgi:hypothetical protein
MDEEKLDGNHPKKDVVEVKVSAKRTKNQDKAKPAQPYKMNIPNYMENKRGNNIFDVRTVTHTITPGLVGFHYDPLLDGPRVTTQSFTVRDDIGSRKIPSTENDVAAVLERQKKRNSELPNLISNEGKDSDKRSNYTRSEISLSEFSVSGEDKKKTKNIIQTVYTALSKGKKISAGNQIDQVPYLAGVGLYGKHGLYHEEIPEFGKITGENQSNSIDMHQTLSKLKRKLRNEDKELVQIRKANEEKEKDYRSKVAKSVNAIAGAVANVASTTIELALKVALLKDTPMEQRRLQMAQLYFVPKRITGKAISLVLTSIPKEGSPKPKSYNLPSRFEVTEFGKKLGYNNLEEFVSDVEIGLKQQETAKLFGRKPVENERGVKSGVMRELGARAEESEDGSALDELAEDGIIEIESEDEQLQEAIPAVFKNKLSQQCYYPFKFSAEFSYCVLYYHYFYLYGYLLPFGKTQPDLPWLYIFSLMIDPKNTLQLRLTDEQVAFKIGGLGLLERKFVSEDSEFSSVHKLLIQPILTSGADISKFKNILVDSFKAIAKLQSGSCRMQHLINKISLLSQSMTVTQRSLISICESQSLQETPAIKTILHDARSAYQAGIKYDGGQQNMLSIFGEGESKERQTLRSILAPLRPEVAHFCNIVTSMYEKIDRDPKAVHWFDSLALQSLTANDGPISYFLNMAKSAGTRQTLINNFPSKKVFEKIFEYVMSRREYIKSASGEQKKKIHSNPYLRMPLRYEWSVEKGQSVLVSEMVEKADAKDIHEKLFLRKRVPLEIAEGEDSNASVERAFGSTKSTHSEKKIGSSRKKDQQNFARAKQELVDFNRISAETFTALLQNTAIDTIVKEHFRFLEKSKNDPVSLLKDFGTNLLKGLAESLKMPKRTKDAAAKWQEYTCGDTDIDTTLNYLEEAATLLTNATSPGNMNILKNLNAFMNSIQKYMVVKKLNSINQN